MLKHLSLDSTPKRNDTNTLNILVYDWRSQVGNTNASGPGKYDPFQTLSSNTGWINQSKQALTMASSPSSWHFSTCSFRRAIKGHTTTVNAYSRVNGGNWNVRDFPAPAGVGNQIHNLVLGCIGSFWLSLVSDQLQ